MNQEKILSDSNISLVQQLLDKCSKELNVEVLSLVLYGSKVKEAFGSNIYELIVLIDNNTKLNSFVSFTNLIRIMLIKEKLNNVKILVYTPEIFQDILIKDKIIGTFLYIVCKENIILNDVKDDFKNLKEMVLGSAIKSEEEFLKQCIEFCKYLGSVKWAEKWERDLKKITYKKMIKNS